MNGALVRTAIGFTFAAALIASAQTPESSPHASSSDTAISLDSQAAPMAVPFSVGERSDYDVKFGAIKVGSASTIVKDIEDVRGISTWHTVFQLKGGTFFYRVNDVFESWIDRTNFSSLRFYQTQEEGSSNRQKRYEIYPDRGMYTEMDKKPPRDHPGVKNPLDDGSFLFFVRTLPLEVGRTYESERYFRPEVNPIRVRVLRKETIEVPAGKFDCIVLQPVIKTKGIFSENGDAEVWLSDDSRHILVQLKSKLSFGSINLYLRSYKPGS
ncbi:MAG TPA: DUF3108 domain-containing protein [Gemmatimonadaceae bacterium]|jgi:hypothetical protein